MFMKDYFGVKKNLTNFRLTFHSKNHHLFIDSEPFFINTPNFHFLSLILDFTLKIIIFFK
jgi:hypothetical protein